MGRPAHVYFVRPVGQDGPVKIGISILPESRLRAQMVWSPIPLELVAQIAGDMGLERRFHQRFIHLHSHSEWFRADPELTATIEAIRSGTFDLSTLPTDAKRLHTEAQMRAWRRLVPRRSFASPLQAGGL